MSPEGNKVQLVGSFFALWLPIFPSRGEGGADQAQRSHLPQFLGLVGFLLQTEARLRILPPAVNFVTSRQLINVMDLWFPHVYIRLNQEYMCLSSMARCIERIHMMLLLI